MDGVHSASVMGNWARGLGTVTLELALRARDWYLLAFLACRREKRRESDGAWNPARCVRRFERMGPVTFILSLAAEGRGGTAAAVLIYAVLALLVAGGGALIAVNIRKLVNDWPRMKPRHNVDVAFVQIYLGVVLLTLAWIIATDPSQKFREARSPVMVSPDAR